MRTKAAYDNTLARLDTRLKQTHQDLQELKAVNQNARAESQKQIERAATEMQNSSDKNQGR